MRGPLTGGPKNPYDHLSSPTQPGMNTQKCTSEDIGRQGIYAYINPNNTIQYDTIQYHTIQYNTIQYNTTQYHTIQYNVLQRLTYHNMSYRDMT